ncbi:MAG: prolipoprotein diacylglyceryl transferase family protein [Acidobacteriota bacterium]
MRSRIIAGLGLEQGSFLVPDYWFMLTLALIAGAWITLRRCRRAGMNRDDAAQAIFYSLLFLFPMARLIYAVQYWDQFARAPWRRLIDPTQGGLALLGGLFGFLAGAICLRRRGQSVGVYLDATVPGLALGLFLGRTGCFLAGCNWGKTTDLPWAVCFPPPHHAWRQHVKAGLLAPDAPLSLPVHPTQLYESIFGLLVFGIALWWLRREYAAGVGLKQPGRTFLFAISAYAVFRLLVEYVRADASGLQFGPFSVAQGLSLGILAGCQAILFYRGRARRRLGPSLASSMLFLFFLPLNSLFAAADLGIPNIKAQAGGRFLVPITLSGGQEIAGLQFRVKFDPSLVSAPGAVMPIPGDLLAGHTLGASPAGNEVSVVVFSSSLAALRQGQGTVAHLILQLSGAAAAGATAPLQLVEVQACDAAGESVSLTSHDGSVTNSAQLDLPADGVNELVFPQVANGTFPGGSFLSSLLVVNRTAATVTAKVGFYKSTGAAFNLRLSDGRIGSEFPLTVAEGGSALLQTDGSGPLEAGYARLTASGPVGGTILFTQRDGGGNTLVEAGVGASPAGTRFVIPVLYQKNASNTGVAFANVSPAATDLGLTLRDRTGALLGTANVPLGPGQHSPQYVTGLFALADSFAGVLEAESALPVSAVALKQQGAILTTFPVITTLYNPPALNPVPAVTSLSPGSATAGGPAFTLTVNGADFVSGAEVHWNGAARSTTFVSANQLTASVPASDTATAGTATVTVLNPAPGGGLSNGVAFAVSPAPQPQIQVSPASLDFDTVNTGETRQLIFTVQNSGTATLTVQSIAKTSAVFTVSAPALPFSVAPGAQQAVTVTFAPTDAGVVSDTLTVTSDDPAHPTVTVSVTGEGYAGTAPAIQAATLTKLANYSVKADVQLSDPDGDIVKLEFFWYRGPNLHNTTTINSPADVNLAGLTSGTISYTFQDLGITTPFGKVSPDRVEIQATDSRNLVSNKYSKDL